MSCSAEHDDRLEGGAVVHARDGVIDLIERERDDQPVDRKAPLASQVHQFGNEQLREALALNDAPDYASQPNQLVDIKSGIGPTRRSDHAAGGV
jgi:hypothetical protein